MSSSLTCVCVGGVRQMERERERTREKGGEIVTNTDTNLPSSTHLLQRVTCCPQVGPAVHTLTRKHTHTHTSALHSDRNTLEIHW